MHCRRAGQDRADRGRAHLICDGLQQRDRQCSRTCEGKRKTDEVFILAWARTKTRQLEPSNKRNEGLRQQRQLESGRDAGGQSGHLWGAVFSGRCDKENNEIVLCGLSLGAVLALNYAIDHPDKVKALVLIAAQYEMPEKLLKFQNLLFHVMPNAMFEQFGFKKADVIRLCGTMAELDLRDSLYKVSCPALIVCGEKDNANKKASKELASYLSDAHFHELLKTGHEANIESPEELAMVLQRFYDNIIG